MRLPGSLADGLLARAALVVLRIYLGGLLLALGLRHLRDTDASQYGEMIGWGALLIGVLLLIGLLTRLLSAVVLVVTVSALVRQAPWPPTPSAVELAMAAIALSLVIGAPGRTWGADALLARRWPRSPFW